MSAFIQNDNAIVVIENNSTIGSVGIQNTVKKPIGLVKRNAEIEIIVAIITTTVLDRRVEVRESASMELTTAEAVQSAHNTNHTPGPNNPSPL